MKINEKIQLSKLGVDLIRSIVDHNNCFFHDIKQESDLGIDAIIEFLFNGETTGKSIAVQIKTGKSYYDINKKGCMFPIENHESYWLSYELPVYGFVCDLNSQCFYYVNISEYLRNERCEKSTISFKIEYFNTIDTNNFSNLFLGLLLQKTPYLNFSEARKLALSDSINDSSLGLFILRKHHYKMNSTWSVFSLIFRKEYFYDSSMLVLEFLSVGTHNPDVFHDNIDYIVCSQYAKEQIQAFSVIDIIHLLNLVDDENSFCRGSVGELVDFTIQEIPNKTQLLLTIINNNEIDSTIRERALFLLACYDANIFMKIAHDIDLPSCQNLLYLISTYGYINPYA